LLNALSFAAARAGDMTLAIETTMMIHKIAGFSRTGSMALYQAALWSYQMRDYEAAENRFKALKPNRISRAYQKEVQWYLGWLRYLRGDFVAAEKSFRSLMRSRRGQIQGESQDRLNYWLAMAQLQSGKREKAKLIFSRLSDKKGMNYYSFLAQERLKLIPETPPETLVKEINPVIVSLSHSQYFSPYMELAPRPSSQEMEDEEWNS
jgi:TolA-binding protein